jgi:hypothetical protein
MPAGSRPISGRIQEARDKSPVLELRPGRGVVAIHGARLGDRKPLRRHMSSGTELNELLLDREKNLRLLERLTMLLLADDEPPKTLLAKLKKSEQKEQEFIQRTDALTA